MKLKLSNIENKLAFVVLSMLTGLILISSLAFSVHGSPYNHSESCKDCHEKVYEQWSRSLHSISHIDPVFKGAYFQAIEYAGEKTKERCMKCHSPMTRVTQDYDLELEISREGVTCDFCHTISDVIIENGTINHVLSPGVVKYGNSKEQIDEHGLGFSEFFRKSEFCGGCHELYSPNGIAVMGTYSEWKNGPYRNTKQCQDCHMSDLDGVSSHRFTGGHFESRVKQAARLDVSMEIKDDNAKIIVNVSNVGAGHKIPTGIPSRMLILHVVAKDTRGNQIFKEDRTYRKALVTINGTEITDDFRLMLNSVEILSDNRIAPLESRIETFEFIIPSGIKQVYAEAKLEYSYKPEILVPTEITAEMAADSTIKVIQQVEGPKSEVTLSREAIVLWIALLAVIAVAIIRKMSENRK